MGNDYEPTGQRIGQRVECPNQDVERIPDDDHEHEVTLNGKVGNYTQNQIHEPIVMTRNQYQKNLL